MKWLQFLQLLWNKEERCIFLPQSRHPSRIRDENQRCCSTRLTFQKNMQWKVSWYFFFLRWITNLVTNTPPPIWKQTPLSVSNVLCIDFQLRGWPEDFQNGESKIHQISWLWESVQELCRFNQLFKRHRWPKGSILRNTVEHIATKDWIMKDGDFGQTIKILILGERHWICISWCPYLSATYMEFHFENFISSFKNLRNRLWLTAEVNSRLTSPVLHIKLLGPPKFKMAKEIKNRSRVNF